MLSLAAFTSGAHATTITFETAPHGGGFTGPITESGYTYALSSGGLYVANDGIPGKDIEGSEVSGGGILDIVAVGGGGFNFGGLDYSVFGSSAKPRVLSVTGYRAGLAVGNAAYSLVGKNVVPYGNWTTEGASALSGLKIDELKIALAAGLSPETFSENIDNVLLLSASGAVPEPAAWALMLVGFGGLGGGLRVSRRGRLRVLGRRCAFAD